jgi:DNA-binding transcriptional LysR family regulator
MEWGDLRFLLAVQRTGSLSAAARALRVNQTTVGRRLAALEEQLGTRLFLRDATGYALTEAGRSACEIGERMEEVALSLERKLGGKDVGVEGVVRITTPSGFVPDCAASLAELTREHPRLSFHLLSDVATLNLINHEADIAVRMVNPGQPSLIARRLGEMPWSLYASEDYVRRCGLPRGHAGRSLLARHTVIAYDDALARTPGGRWIEAHGAGATVAARTNNAMAALDLAAAGLGLAAAPVNLGARKEGVRAILRPADLGGSTVFLVTHRDLAKVPRIRATMDRLAADIGAGLAALGGRRR